MLSFSLILIAAMVAVGITELVKNFLPETVNGKVVAGISMVISVAVSVGICVYQKQPVEAIFLNTLVVVGLAQTSYNYVLRLLNKYMDMVTEKILEKSIENEFGMIDLENVEGSVEAAAPTEEDKK